MSSYRYPPCTEEEQNKKHRMLFPWVQQAKRMGCRNPQAYGEVLFRDALEAAKNRRELQELRKQIWRQRSM